MKPANRPSVLPLLPVLLLAAALAALAACQGRSLGETLWPDLYDPYFQLTDEWSRRGVIRMGLETEVSFVALLKSEQWRRAYVERHAHLQGLSPREKEKMLADQIQAHEEGVDVILAAASTYPDHARMTHRTSRWEVFLQSPEGQKIPALEIRPMQWSRLELEAYFPAYRHWQRYYAVRFPPGLEVPITLVVTGPPGRTVMIWDEHG